MAFIIGSNEWRELMGTLSVLKDVGVEGGGGGHKGEAMTASGGNRHWKFRAETLKLCLAISAPPSTFCSQMLYH